MTREFDADDSDGEAGHAGSGERPIRHDWRDAGQASIGVVEAVAAVTGRAPTALPPLQGRLDTDALDEILRSGDDDAGAADGVRVAFTYAGTRVAVGSDGWIEVWEVGDGSDDATATATGGSADDGVARDGAFDGEAAVPDDDGRASLDGGVARDASGLAVPPRTRAELAATIRTVLRAAARNGVTVEGGYSADGGPELPDWDVHVTRVERPDERDEDS